MTPTPTLATHWSIRTRSLTFENGPLVMGIVNVTPDSFSDGGCFANTPSAVDHALRLADQGAAILDIGGESTRPNSTPVGTQEELDRVIPVIEKIVAQSSIPISIDTSKSAVARAALDAGAEIINDVTGLERDPEMQSVAKSSAAGICAMHMQGTPQTMQDNPTYDNVVTEIHHYLSQRKTALVQSGIEPEKICLDPGIGFGKTHEHNIQLLNHCENFLDLGCPILVGHSRKGFIGKLIGDKSANRDIGTLAISILLAQKRIQIIRVHEVENTVIALKTIAGFI